MKEWAGNEDPYYDGSWEINFAWPGDLPGVGTLVVMTGAVRNGVLIVQSVKTI